MRYTIQNQSDLIARLIAHLSLTDEQLTDICGRYDETLNKVP